MSLTSYRAAPPRGKAFGYVIEGFGRHIRLVDLAATYSPAP
jgi:hypothetical protein